MPIRTFVNNVRVSKEKTGKDFSQFMDELKELTTLKEQNQWLVIVIRKLYLEAKQSNPDFEFTFELPKEIHEKIWPEAWKEENNNKQDDTK